MCSGKTQEKRGVKPAGYDLFYVLADDGNLGIIARHLIHRHHEPQGRSKDNSYHYKH